MSRFFFGTNNPQRMLQQASHHVKSNLSRREGCVWGKVVSPGTIVKWSQDILFSHWVFFHHGVTWTSNILQMLMHFVDLWSINKVDIVCLWASQSTKKREKFITSNSDLWSEEVRRDLTPRHRASFLSGALRFFGRGSMAVHKMSVVVCFGGGSNATNTNSHSNQKS